MRRLENIIKVSTNKYLDRSVEYFDLEECQENELCMLFLPPYKKSACTVHILKAFAKAQRALPKV